MDFLVVPSKYQALQKLLHKNVRGTFAIICNAAMYILGAFTCILLCMQPTVGQNATESRKAGLN